MMNNDLFFTQPEIEYRKQRAARSIAAVRGSRSRSSWLRRLAATDPSTDTTAR